MGFRDRPISPRSPWQNPYAERLPGRRRLFLTHFQHVEDLEAIERLGGAPDPELDAHDQRDASLAPLQRCASWITGFAPVEIDQLTADFEDDPSDPADTVDPRWATAAVVTRPGDLWELGRHRLLCGDARGADDLARLMGGAQAAMAFLDPPYNVRVCDIVGRGRVKHTEFAMASGELSRADFVQFLESTLVGLCGLAREDSNPLSYGPERSSKAQACEKWTLTYFITSLFHLFVSLFLQRNSQFRCAGNFAVSLWSGSRIKPLKSDRRVKTCEIPSIFPVIWEFDG